MKKLPLLMLLLMAVVDIGFAQSAPTLYQKPTANRTQIVFVYAGDLWSVAREGGDARRLTTGVGEETDPIFSPDGSTIAFTGQYDGNTDVYIVPANGGVPKRLTYHPGEDEVAGWTPDGKQVLFTSGRESYRSFNRLFTIGLDGGLANEVQVPMGVKGSYSPDGNYIAYEPLTRWQPDWKRYRGGQSSYLWIAKLADSTVEKIPRENSNDTNPMWIGDKVYFLSDRDSASGAVGLFVYDTKTKKVTPVIVNSGLDIKSASAAAGGGGIVYEQFGTVHWLDLKSGKSQQVNIRVAGDLLSVRPRYERVGQRIANAAISPTGARAVFEARGEILSVPAEKGDPRNLTSTVGVMERSPGWSPDGKWIAYFSDESGEYALHLRDQMGTGEVRKIALPPSFYYSLTWSPDSKKIAFNDKKNLLYYVEVEKGTPVRIDKNPDGFAQDVLDVSWAPDSKWLTYARQLDNHLRGIFIYSLETGKAHQVSDGLSDARYPAFDASGKYLYFTASTNLGPAFSFAEMSNFPHQSSRSVYAMVLRQDLPSPLAPESDEEKIAEEKKDEKKDEAKPATPPANAQPPAGPRPPAKKEPEPVKIDFEGIDQRTIALPVPSLNFVGLAVGKANTVYILELPPGGPGGGGFGGFGGATLHKFDLEKRKLDKAMEGVTSFVVSANGEKALIRQGPATWIIRPTATLGAPMPPGMPPGAPGGPGAAAPLKVNEMEVYIDPKAEWKQMFHEVWRGHRDFFYDPNAHGLNLAEAEKKYAPYLEAVAHRSDLNYLFTEMSNQLTVGHMFIGGGDVPRPNFVPGGLLGADYKIENGRYRFAQVYNGESWNPNLRAPLTQPGVNVKAGEYLLAVNGRELRATDNVYSFFESKANKQVVIKVGPSPDGSGSREVTVTPVAGETGLRNLAWVEGNRRKVEQLSGGKLAYVYVPDTSGGGYTSFNRYFFSQSQKDGAVIDERFNQGGSLADYIVEYLSRPLLNYIYFRDGRDVPTPLGAIYGPKAMLINESAGSGGDALPWYFRKMKIGPLIGKRTWGGLIASQALPPLMDGGFVTSPDAAIYGLNGEWEVENAGVGPDVEVEFDPAAWRQGRDPQLEKAVEWLLEELKKNPRPQHKRPAFPVYHK